MMIGRGDSSHCDTEHVCFRGPDVGEFLARGLPWQAQQRLLVALQTAH